MTRWDPSQYRKFASERLRPGYELMGRVGDFEPRSIVDLGCGTGELTLELCRRYPASQIQGIDSSPQMLQKARRLSSHVQWIQGDIETWRPEGGCDLIFTNAALQWVREHDALLARLVSFVAPSGTFAMQVPANFGSPSHQLLYETLAEMHLDGPSLRGSILPADGYGDALQPHFDEVDVWSTEYVHLLAGEDAVLEWMRGTTLRPILSVLDDTLATQVVESYRHKLRLAYPTDSSGATRFTFLRLFAVGRQKR